MKRAIELLKSLKWEIEDWQGTMDMVCDSSLKYIAASDAEDMESAIRDIDDFLTEIDEDTKR